MSGLAKLLLKHGARVRGSDQAQSRTVEKLCRLGADIKIGHSAGHLACDTETVVISAAVENDNPELVAARQRGCKIKKYAEMLGELMNGYDGIAVAGTHGKSTTAGWLSYVLKQARLEPNYIIGAEITQLHNSSGAGSGRHFVVEACEYDRSFLNLRPKVACVLNIEPDHLDYYRDEGQIVEAFCEFASGIKAGGTLVANYTDPNVRKVTAALPSNVNCRTFGFDDRCDFVARNARLLDGTYSFELVGDGKLLGSTHIQMPGKHNVLNALAVIAMTQAAGLEGTEVLEHLPGFAGIDRRLMLKAQIDGVTILDDYAHHPTEIKASLGAIRQRYEPSRLWCVFQPHQYSRTRFFLDDFAESFKLADITIVPEIYFVRDSQQDKKEINARILIERIRDNGSEAIFIESFEAICDYLRQNVTPGDVVVTMGAGNIWKVADEFIQWLGKNR